MLTEEKIMNSLRQVIDPEIGLDIVELGLVYNLKFDDNSIKVVMTLTTPGCPMHSSIVSWVENVLKQLDNNVDVVVELVWEPQWTPDMMSSAAKEQLGY